MGRITRNVAVTRVTRGDGRILTDTRAGSTSVEEPLEIRAGGRTLTTTMRTPGHDVELAHGWLYAEGLIASLHDVSTARYCAGAVGPEGRNTYNLLDIDLDTAPDTTARRAPTIPLQLAPPAPGAGSACGVSGEQTISELLHRVPSPGDSLALDPELVMGLPAALRAQQKPVRKTGGIHAAGAFGADGAALVVREDIDAHNAADKVVGHMLLEEQLPAVGTILVVTSRASFELAKKAAAAGFSALVAAGPASSLAVELARRAGVALAGDAGEEGFRLYAGELQEGRH